MKIQNRDILGISSEGEVGVVTMIKYRSSKLIAKETFEINTSDSKNENVKIFHKVPFKIKTLKLNFLLKFNFKKNL